MMANRARAQFPHTFSHVCASHAPPAAWPLPWLLGYISHSVGERHTRAPHLTLVLALAGCTRGLSGGFGAATALRRDLKRNLCVCVWDEYDIYRRCITSYMRDYPLNCMDSYVCECVCVSGLCAYKCM